MFRRQFNTPKVVQNTSKHIEKRANTLTPIRHTSKTAHQGNACERSPQVQAGLLAQKRVLGQLAVTAVAVVLNVGFNYGLIYGAGLGFPGSPLATVAQLLYGYGSMTDFVSV